MKMFTNYELWVRSAISILDSAKYKLHVCGTFFCCCRGTGYSYYVMIMW